MDECDSAPHEMANKLDWAMKQRKDYTNIKCPIHVRPCTFSEYQPISNSRHFRKPPALKQSVVAVAFRLRPLRRYYSVDAPVTRAPSSNCTTPVFL